jgi:hypothetical protein
MTKLGGNNKTQPIVWGNQESWHIVENGPCYALWKDSVFIGNCDRTQSDLESKIAYVNKYHMAKES